MSGKALSRITWAVYGFLGLLLWNYMAFQGTGLGLGALLLGVPITAGLVILGLLFVALAIGLFGTALQIIGLAFNPKNWK